MLPITEALKAIRVAGYKTFVATSKPHIYATRIVEYFSLSLLFDGIYGSDFDGTRSAKADLISHILLTENLSPSSVVMVGDNFVKLR
ncbi:MAG: HAD hydrolase-like protein [Nostoc sp. DedQUE12a]|nr:HAD hydrolase-like protein [Nostoc sp. DedQUE12a]